VAGVQQPERAFFTSDLDPEEIDRIIGIIEQNLRFRQSLTTRTEATFSAGLPRLPGVAAPFSEIESRLQRLHSEYAWAPLFVAGGRDPRGVVKRLLNLPLRVFGRRQIRFNREVSALLADITLALHASAQKDHEFQSRQQATTDWLQSVADRQEGTESWLDSVAKRQEGLERWTSAIQNEVRDVEFEIRERTSDLGAQRIAPRILDPDAYPKKIKGLPDGLKVNLGAGRDALADYVNVDFRAVTGVDVVADVRDLPFEAGSLTEISSSHLVEHFREYELKTRILPYWLDLLKPSGRLRIVCPNWEEALRETESQRMDIARFKEITFGGQEYEGDDHFAMYTPATLTALLLSCGFARAEVLVANRDNNGCPEMEIVAYRGEAGT